MSPSPRDLPVKPALGVGMLWSLLLFANDTGEAWLGFQRALGKIEADEGTRELIARAIADYVLRIGAGHVILGLLGAAWVFCWLRLLVPGTRRPVRWGLVLAGLSTLCLYGVQITHLPTLHDWFPWREAWTDLFTPGVLAAVLGALLVGLLTVPLRRWGPRSPELWRRLGALGVVVLVLLGLTWEPAPPPAVQNDGPNVVIIGIDSLRPDHLASEGYLRDTAPAIDAFLAEAVRFDEAWTPLARTYPAWSAILTGALPLDLGIRDNLPAPEDLVPELPTLPQVLGEAGFHSRFVTDDSRFSYMVPELGWDAIDQPPVSLQNFVVSSREPHYRAFHAFFHGPLGDLLLPVGARNQAFGKSYRPQRWIDRASRELARASAHERFFFATHACFLHAPGDRIWPWHQLHGQRGYRGKNRFRYLRSGSARFLNDGSPSDRADLLAEQDVRIYDSGIDMADRHVAAVMGQLREAGLLDRTLVVLLSDHGEEHYAEDLPYSYMGPNHGFHPYGDGQHRVLLAVRFPDGRGAGSRVEGTARLIDLAPTLAEELGLDWPAEVRGRSLLPLLEGADEGTGEVDDGTAEEREVYIETGTTEPRYWHARHRDYPFESVSERYAVDAETGRVHIRTEFHEALVLAKDRVLQRGRWKLVYRPEEPLEDDPFPARIQLYDRVADPLNRVDLSEEEPEILAELMAGLAPYLARDGMALPRRPLAEGPTAEPGDLLR